ncbi:helix-turn-helix domain-containing protein [Paenibacillus sp. HJL G12]|uniref:Helix-turn-helix domain-containing protein n=1 Tax=Paenibacillus dendrobii TaxID=2691084 RepID=A0A7X3INJ4_9BACL|nr:AraC family transcriptional regulator [Paenibacillus dendrobii]MWV47223.1 helix-turn-helix domain-containing protein [Paenibacillus dendrobii]
MDTIRKTDGFQSEKLIVLPDHIMKEASEHPLVRPLYVTDTGYFPRALHHYRERPAGSEAYIMIYCMEGEGWYRLNGGRKQEVLQGQAVVIPAHTPHEYASSEEHPWSIYWWHMKGEHVQAFFEGFGSDAGPVSLPLEKARQLGELFHEGYALLEQGYTLSHIIYVSQLAGHLAAILRHSRLQPQTGGSQHGKHDITQTVRYMMDHLERSVTLKELAAQANVSVPHFTQRFKEATGYSPIDYYLRLKIQLACRHLDLTEQSVKEISHRLGFQDPYYFSRLFKKVMGKPPTEYRDTRKG